MILAHARARLKRVCDCRIRLRQAGRVADPAVDRPHQRVQRRNEALIMHALDER
jgi:hypothetical protein